MLPVEAFAEAVSFLRLFDLDALLLANALGSSLALKASAAIRWEAFPCLGLYITDRWIDIRRIPSPDDGVGQHLWQPVATLTFRCADETAEFIAAAFRNCVFDNVALSPLSKPLVDAMDRVGNSVIINGALRPPHDMSLADILSLVRKFRKVKVSFMSHT